MKISWYNEIEEAKMTDLELEALFANGITREGLKKLFNPYAIMKPLEDHGFSQEILYELERKTSYDELKNSLPYSTYFGGDKDKLFESAIKTFLSYKDNMPFYPTVEDWMKEISAPEEFIKRIIPENGVFLSTLFCDCTSELRAVFWKKIKKMEELEDDNYENGKFDFSENYFYDYFSDKISSTVKSQWEKYLYFAGFKKKKKVYKRENPNYKNRQHTRAVS